MRAEGGGDFTPLVSDSLRPQDPTDFPYRREAVRFPGGAPGVELAGELTVPDSGAIRAVAILLTGSGPQDRNEDLGPHINHRPFLVLSDYLTRRGYGVLRYDDRGVGESSGRFSGATSADFAADAAAAVAYLRHLPDVQHLPLGLIGHSEGGLIAPMVVASGAAVDYLILLAAPGLPIDSLMLEQRRMIAGQTTPDEPVVRGAFTFVRRHPELDSATFVAGLQDTILSLLPQLAPPVRASISDPELFAATYARGLSSAWFRYFLSLDPADYLSQVSVPVLALNGEKDLQVSPGNLTALEESLTRAGNLEVTAIVLPGLNHLFQPATTGHPAEYGAIETTLAPEVLQRIADWLDNRF
ncbi:alpha/beta hydrolase [Neolewinella marina]|uniref:Alpha/beta hydrolase n=1 Tax=Neolewinella marina TaxID=438751 RepID=A0A2G0CGA9_9BACT|nr:alpha/beta hydrolase [Neolewinella marina]